ncbi:hypothetical protein BO78DRAFT_444903 [Aspergillus sclerotiicarbonarius CBS 121057]|uniref:Ankyrin n=1 Tax=Aspergillus sclerotiicarbonarius (strain CBS 121057 / IBT 28362) TaxID=1448318 RepID=A0A319EA95_ASPSB|nr:hypothetical protein BO78DRAFT_444903 [Aspergillus sclerotiicarbonarius CBS 121057]
MAPTCTRRKMAISTYYLWQYARETWIQSSGFYSMALLHHISTFTPNKASFERATDYDPESRSMAEALARYGCFGRAGRESPHGNDALAMIALRGNLQEARIATSKKWGTASLLVARGASARIEDTRGSTPVDLAVRGDPKIVHDIFGAWEGHYQYISWNQGAQEPFSVNICRDDLEGDSPMITFSSEDHDLVGPFSVYGFLDAKGKVWFVKLYAKLGWLYRGELSQDRKTMKGTWGSNRKLWYVISKN